MFFYVFLRVVNILFFCWFVLDCSHFADTKKKPAINADFFGKASGLRAIRMRRLRSM